MLTHPLFPTGDATARHRAFALGVLTGLLVVGPVALVLAAPAIAFRELNLIARPFLVAAPVAAGFVWRRRRPRSRTGPLLIVLGWLGAAATLQLSGNGLLAQVGLLADALIATIQAYLVVSYPNGRLRTNLERTAVGALVVALVIGAIRLPLVPVLRPLDFLSACGTACPPNPLFVGDRLGTIVGPDAFRFAVVGLYGIFVSVPVILVFRDRWRQANRRERAALQPLAATAFLLFPARVLTAVTALALGVGPESFLPVTALSFAARLLFPIGFLFALLRAELLASRAVTELVARLSGDRDRSTWALTIAETLDDPTVRVAFRSGDDLVDTAGSPLGPETAPGRLRLRVEREDGLLAVVETSEALLDDPELTAAVISATRIAAESGELLDDVRTSRARLVGAADAERERLGRDLHDSAQQRLVALRIRLRLARERIGEAGEDAGLEELDEELGVAADELRSVARGIYPSLLARDGIRAALRTATRGWTVPIEIRASGIERRPEEVEAAVYFVCLEALQNVVKHAGDGARAVVILTQRGEGIELAVTDDGLGFDRAVADEGAGFQHMRDRMAAIGGGLAVEGSVGHGTTVRGWTER